MSQVPGVDSPPAEPTGAGTPVSVFEVVSEPPDSGWWTVAVHAGTQSCEIHASNIADPIGDVLAWLEAIVAGTPSRLTIDAEGNFAELCAYPVRDGQLRLVVVSRSARVLDAHVPAARLVEAFYKSLDVFRSDDARTKWHWLCVYDEEGDHGWRPVLRSQKIETFFAGIRRL